MLLLHTSFLGEVLSRPSAKGMLEYFSPKAKININSSALEQNGNIFSMFFKLYLRIDV